MMGNNAAQIPGGNDGDLIADFNAHRQEFLAAYLRQIGLADREMSALWDQVPEPIRRSIPETQGGYGLSGGYGVGKTFAVAAQIRMRAEEEVLKAMDRMVAQKEEDFLLREAVRRKKLHLQPFATWINWPSDIATYRAKLYMSDEKGKVETWIQEELLSKSKTVVLDDIGAEHVTGADWVGEVLSRVIDERYRWGRPTIWTSNLEKIALAERYGGRLFSRLDSLAPVVELPKLPDLRRRP